MAFVSFGLVLSIVVACTSATEEQADVSDSSVPAAAQHFVADTGVEGAPQIGIDPDWSFNVSDPEKLFEHSLVVVSGKVVGVEGSHVSLNGDIETLYTVEVETVYKGDKIGDVISISMPGGTVPLGEYISSLDEIGLYEMKLGPKYLDTDCDGVREPMQAEDPRAMDPNFPVTENWGLNPASASTLSELQPESWVFYLGGSAEGVYYGTALDYSLKYLKGGYVHSMNVPVEVPAFPESELSER